MKGTAFEILIYESNPAKFRILHAIDTGEISDEVLTSLAEWMATEAMTVRDNNLNLLKGYHAALVAGHCQDVIYWHDFCDKKLAMQMALPCFARTVAYAQSAKPDSRKWLVAYDAACELALDKLVRLICKGGRQ